MIPLLDFSDKLTISNTTYDDADTTKTYILKVPAGKYLKIKEIAVNVDSNFSANGKLQMFLNGNSFSSMGEAKQEITPQSGFDVDWGDRSKFFMCPGEELMIPFRVTTGSATVQAMVTGMQLNEPEYKKELEK